MFRLHNIQLLFKKLIVILCPLLFAKVFTCGSFEAVKSFTLFIIIYQSKKYFIFIFSHLFRVKENIKVV